MSKRGLRRTQTVEETWVGSTDAILERAASVPCMGCLHRFDDHAAGSWCQLVVCSCAAFQGPSVRYIVIDNVHDRTQADEVEHGTSTGSTPPTAEPRPWPLAVKTPEQLD